MRTLSDEAFEVRPTATGREAVQTFTADPPDLLVLDIGLPDADGRDVCQALRAHGIDVPVLFLTARGQLTDRLSGFHAGGDDYLTKPFALAELVVRVRALLRRAGGEERRRRDRARQHARRLHRTAAAQAARPWSERGNRDRARRRLRPAVSLRNRVTLASLAVLGTGLAIVGIALNLVLANRLSADGSSVLRERAAAQLATLDTSGPSLSVHDGAGDAVLDQQAWVFDQDGRLIERPPADGRLVPTAQALRMVSAPTERSIDETARLLGVPAYDETGKRRVGTVVVGISLGPYERTEHLAALGTLLLSLLVLAGGALLARRAVNAALRPVASMTTQAARWGERDLHQRFDLGPPRDELTGLAATLDGLLGRLDAALRHEQRFSAEVAHELRTPLSGVRGEAELALRGQRTDAELRQALERVLAGTERMAAVIDTLLAAARNDASGPPGSSDAAAAVRQLAGPRIEVVAPVDVVTVGADQDLVMAALQPLLENALRHAERDVRVELRRSGVEVVIAVSDDGPGVAPEDAERIFAPGVSDAGGAGLGLALSRRLARAAGGEVVVAGSSFELRLPSTDLP
jgi:two-component system OmpR family sensor kinase